MKPFLPVMRYAAILCLPLLAGCVESIHGEATPPPPVAYQPAAPAFTTAALSSPLAQLVAPIALYPDPLVALILPAATNPAEVSQAAQALSAGADPGQLSSQPWDPSVQALIHYPTVLRWMALNPAWTEALGEAFAADPAAAMAQIQRLRSLALSAGTLTSGPQQVVIVSDGVISIEPADSAVLYVPSYNPWQVFVSQRYDGFAGPLIAYGDPWPLGVWLGFGFDWGRGRVLVGDSSAWRHRAEVERDSPTHSRGPSTPELRPWQPREPLSHGGGKPGAAAPFPGRPGQSQTPTPLPRPRLDPVTGRGSAAAPGGRSNPPPGQPTAAIQGQNRASDVGRDPRARSFGTTPAPTAPADRRAQTSPSAFPPPSQPAPRPVAPATVAPVDKGESKTPSDRDRNAATH